MSAENQAQDDVVATGSAGAQSPAPPPRLKVPFKKINGKVIVPADEKYCRIAFSKPGFVGVENEYQLCGSKTFFTDKKKSPPQSLEDHIRTPGAYHWKRGDDIKIATPADISGIDKLDTLPYFVLQRSDDEILESRKGPRSVATAAAAATPVQTPPQLPSQQVIPAMPRSAPGPFYGYGSLAAVLASAQSYVHTDFHLPPRYPGHDHTVTYVTHDNSAGAAVGHHQRFAARWGPTLQGAQVQTTLAPQQGAGAQDGSQAQPSATQATEQPDNVDLDLSQQAQNGRVASGGVGGDSSFPLDNQDFPTQQL